MHIEDDYIREHLLEGCFGLEKESLRVTGEGRFAHTPHPFPDDRNIVRDFCENQSEVNTGIHGSAKEAVQELYDHTKRLRAELAKRQEAEYLWPFSSPPYIENEADIPVAEFTGKQRKKTLYRDYLSDKYGRYIMTFSGIHVNYSFSELLLRRDFAVGGEGHFQDYKSRVYLELAAGLVEYGWLLVILTAASPLLDGSFTEAGKRGETVFTGMASVRCSEAGYWNDFTPVLGYDTLESYVGRIRCYVEQGYLNSPSELYYPIRLKSDGEYDLDVLLSRGVNHIELRMFDLNPLVREGVDVRDVQFAQLLMIWITSLPPHKLTPRDQVRAVKNYMKAAHYDPAIVNFVTRDGYSMSMRDAGLKIISRMQAYFSEFGEAASSVLAFEAEKLQDPSKRYAAMVRERFGADFAGLGLAFAKEY